MAQITWNQLATPDMKAANALLLAGQAQNDAAITQAGKVVTDYQAANTQNNTDAIMNALQSAKSPEEYQAALANAQAIAATKSGDFDQQKIYQTQMNQPGVLDAQQQQQYGFGDRDTMNQIAALRATGQFDQAAALLPNLKQSANIQGATQSIQDSLAAASKIKHDREAEKLAVEQAAETANNAKEANSINRDRLKLEHPAAGGRINSDGSLTMGVLGGTDKPSTPSAPYTDVSGAASGFTTKLQGSDAESTPGSVDRNTVKNPQSTASGAFQFIDSTFLKSIGDADPSLTGGLNGTQLLAKYKSYSNPTAAAQDPVLAPILALKSDPTAQNKAMTQLSASNATSMQAKGIPLTDSNMYSSHLLGIDNGVDQTAIIKDAASTDPLSKYIPAKTLSRVLKGNPQLRDMSVGDYRTWLDKKMGVTGAGDPSKSSSQKGQYAFGTKVFAPIQTEYKQKMNDLNADIIKNQKYDANANDPNISTHKAQLAQYLADNKLGLVGSALGLNSGSMQQLDIAKTVPGFNELSPRAQLGTLKELAAWNNSNGAFSKYTNMSSDALKQKVASIVSDSVKAYNGTADDRKQLMFNNAIINVRGKLLENNVNPMEPSNQEIIDAMFGKAEGKNFKDTAATNAAASNITAAAAPVATSPVVPTPVVPAKPNPAASKTVNPIVAALIDPNRAGNKRIAAIGNWLLTPDKPTVVPRLPDGRPVPAPHKPVGGLADLFR